MRRFELNKNTQVEPCPQCGQNEIFEGHSQQVAEDCCEVWVICKCGYDPTAHNTDYRMEDVWGGTDNNNMMAALSCSWNEPINEIKLLKEKWVNKRVACVKEDPMDDHCGIPEENKWQIGEEFVVDSLEIEPYGIFLHDGKGHNLNIRRAIII